MSAGERSGMRELKRNLRWAVLLALAADAGLAGWLLSPKAPSVAATHQQLTAVRAELVRAEAESKALELLQARVHRSQQQMQELMAEGMPLSSDSAAKEFNEVNRVALESEVAGANYSFKAAPKVVSGLRRVDIEVQISGNYPNLVRFLNALERSPMFFIIDQVSATGGSRTGAGADNANGAVKLDVKLEAYQQPEPGAPASSNATTTGSGGPP